MTPERYQRIVELFEVAAERGPEARAAFLAQACGGDAGLRLEVETMLAARDPAATLLKGAPLAPSTHLGPYEIVGPLGAGGMGEVYRARDSRLTRDVAIKVLPEGFADSPQRLLRFEREARAVGMLNHPNVLVVYDVGTEGGRPYLVTELLEGQTVRERLAGGALSRRKAIDYARQIAEGLASAHEKNITHRDLKPDNLFLTTDGRAKILDFGLAKLSEPEEHTELTVSGAILGTPDYMSPEQAAGRPVDYRSDIFSFGVVLYEMLSGRRAFHKQTRAETMAAILREEPPVLEEAPAALQRVVAHCLEKEPGERFQSARDLAFALASLPESERIGSEESLSRADAGLAPPHARRLPWIVAAALALALAGAGILWFGHARQTLPDASLKTVPLTTYPGVERQPSLSPDGSQVAFSWNGQTQQKFDIYVKAVGPGPPLRLTTDAAADTAPAWSPDGSSIAFLRSLGTGKYGVLLIPALGGPERKLAEVSIADGNWISGPYLSWFPDSQSLVFTDMLAGQQTSALFLLSLRTGERRQLTFPPAGTFGDGSVAVSPDGHALAFSRHGTFGEWSFDIYMVEIGSDLMPHGQARPLTNKLGSSARGMSGMAWSADSRGIVFSSRGSLWTLPVNGTSDPVKATPTKLDVAGAGWPATSRHSTRLAYQHGVGGDSDIWRLRIPGPDGRAEPAARLIASTKGEFAQQYSPDGKKIAFESDRGGNLEIWVCDNEGGNCRQVTWIGSAYTGVPSWSPDGQQITFYSRLEGKSHIFTTGAEGGTPRRITESSFNAFYPRWSRDGKWIYFASARTGMNQVWKITPAGGTAVQVTRKGGFAASESPDGKWLYYTKSENAESSLWRVPVAGGEERQVLDSVILHNYAVVDDGIYFIAKSASDRTIRFIGNAGGAPRILAPVQVGYVGFSVSPDRTWLLYTENNPIGSELVLVENFR